MVSYGIADRQVIYDLFGHRDFENRRVYPATDSSRNIDFSLDKNRFLGYRLVARSCFLNDLMRYPITAHPCKLQDLKDIYSY